MEKIGGWGEGKMERVANCKWDDHWFCFILYFLVSKHFKVNIPNLWEGWGGKGVQEGGDTCMGDTCMPMAESCWCMAEAITIL